jgi:hypothetical protein
MPKKTKSTRCLALIRTEDPWSKEGYLVSYNVNTSSEEEFTTENSPVDRDYRWV